MISPPRNRVGTVADAVSRSDLLPRADSGAVLREHELRVVRCRYPLCPRRDCHPKGASAFGPPIRRIAPGKCHSATGDVHRFGARPSKTNNEPRALLAARGYWSLALFLRGVGASPFASCECRTRNLGTGTGGVRLHIFLTSKVVTMLRAYASRVGVFLRDFLSFFSRVAARSRALLFLACTTCVSGRLVAKDFSCGGGRCVCRRRVSAVVACVLARLFSFAKKKPTVDLYRPPSTQGFPCNRKSIRR